MPDTFHGYRAPQIYLDRIWPWKIDKKNNPHFSNLYLG